MSAKWPKRVKHRNRVLAKVYRPSGSRPSYRIVWYADGKRQMKSLPSYSGKGGAKEFAEELVKELARKSQVIMLTPGQANEAMAAIEHLNAFQRDTGRKISLLAAVSEHCQFLRKIGERTANEVADGYMRNFASVTQLALNQAVEEFITGEEPRTRSHNGQRAQIAEKYQYVPK